MWDSCFGAGSEAGDVEAFKNPTFHRITLPRYLFLRCTIVLLIFVATDSLFPCMMPLQVYDRIIEACNMDSSPWNALLNSAVLSVGCKPLRSADMVRADSRVITLLVSPARCTKCGSTRFKCQYICHHFIIFFSDIRSGVWGLCQSDAGTLYWISALLSSLHCRSDTHFSRIY